MSITKVKDDCLNIKNLTELSSVNSHWNIIQSKDKINSRINLKNNFIDAEDATINCNGSWGGRLVATDRKGRCIGHFVSSILNNTTNKQIQMSICKNDDTGNLAYINIDYNSTTQLPRLYISHNPTNNNDTSISTTYFVTKAIEDSSTTSDINTKTDIEEVSEALIRAWSKVNFKVFKYIQSVEIKGSEARKHIGVIVQDVIEAFESEGLNAVEYGIVCLKKYSASTYFNEKTNKEEILSEAKEEWGIRYNEALALECAYLRYLSNKLKLKLEEIEIKLNSIK